MAAPEELKTKTIAVLASDGVELVELTEPVKALEQAGASVEIIGLEDGHIQGFDHLTPGDRIAVHKAVKDASADDYAALLLPGGVANPDNLRADQDAVAFVRAFFDADKPVAAICHAPWVLIEAGAAKGRRLTSFVSIRTDLKNAGADVVNEAVVTDGKLATSRCPDDLPAFNARMVEIFAKG